MHVVIVLLIGIVLGATGTWLLRSRISKDESAAAAALNKTIDEVKAGAAVVEADASHIKTVVIDETEKPKA